MRGLGGSLRTHDLRPLLVLAVVLGAVLLVPAGARATFPGGDGRLAFDRGDRIYTINPDGSDRRQIATRALEPSFSPSGREIVYTEDVAHHGGIQLIIARANGSHPHQVTHGPGGKFEPTWSPDGRHLLYVKTRFANEGGQIYSIGTDGSGLRLLTALPRAGSPDWGVGGLIAFNASQTGTSCATALYTMTPSGMDVRSYDMPSCVNIDPSWSPDGSQLAYIGHGALDIPEVFLSDLSSGERQLTHTSFDDTEWPTFSPSGTEVAFVAARRVYIADAGTGDVHRVPGTARAVHIDWQPR